MITGGVAWFWEPTWLAFVLWCGNYCSVSFKSSVLCHLVIAPVPNSITPNITLQKKVRTLIGQLLIYYLPMGEW